MSLLRCSARRSSSIVPVHLSPSCARQSTCLPSATPIHRQPWRSYHHQPSTSDSIRFNPRIQFSALSSKLQSSTPFSRGRRRFSTSPTSQHGDLDPPKPGEERRVTFIDKEGTSHTFEVADGDNLLDIAQAHDLEMEGACGGSCACSTCHVIVDSEATYEKLEEPSDDENDMLDLAFGLTETSRLGCQVKMAPELDGLVVRLPSMTRNMQASDFSSSKK